MGSRSGVGVNGSLEFSHLKNIRPINSSKRTKLIQKVYCNCDWLSKPLASRRKRSSSGESGNVFAFRTFLSGIYNSLDEGGGRLGSLLTAELGALVHIRGALPPELSREARPHIFGLANRISSKEETAGPWRTNDYRPVQEDKTVFTVCLSLLRHFEVVTFQGELILNSDRTHQGKEIENVGHLNATILARGHLKVIVTDDRRIWKTTVTATKKNDRRPAHLIPPPINRFWKDALLRPISTEGEASLTYAVHVVVVNEAPC
ncbi:hypothetical protein Fcan01_17419 [Folsomia candida]|uniref:Uncharacterized protein n=1 Tax=Folsomia candida TaxID=158441 RepID=A0A226DUI8_FOLCA|nr:hypothetical protein Fcan01_17419 [Folsomia candida]